MTKEAGSEKFISYLMSLEEDDFFFIASNILGSIPTPFHKPVLAGQIAAFFQNEENRTHIMAALDSRDKEYITFILLSGRASEQSILEFFSGDTYYLASSRLDNLKDRLILISEKKEITVNPLLEDDIRSKAFIPYKLLGSTNERNIPRKPIVDTNVLRAMLNLLANGSVPVREANAHHFSKSGKLQTTFPQFEPESINRVFEAVKKLALATGAIQTANGKFIMDRNRSTCFVGAEPLDVALATLDCIAEPGTGVKILKGLGILSKIPAEHGKFILLLKSLERMSSDRASEAVDFLLDFGILVKKDRILYMNPYLYHCSDIPRSVLMTDSDLVVSYFGTPGPDDILHFFADIQQCDNLISYAITKNSFARALDMGFTVEGIIGYLNYPEARQTFEKWEESHCRVKLYDGIILKCTPEIGQIIIQLPDLKSHIIKVLDPTVFILKRSTYSIWQPLLSFSLDMDELTLSSHDDNDKTEFEVIPVHDMPVQTGKPECDSVSDLPSWDEIAAALREDAKAKGVTSEEMEDLIDSKMIISSCQINRAFKYASRPSVSGFDYNGKIVMLRNAIKDGKSLLKLELTDKDVVVKPEVITKKSIKEAVLKAIILPEGTETDISVGSIFKITLLRRSML